MSKIMSTEQTSIFEAGIVGRKNEHKNEKDALRVVKTLTKSHFRVLHPVLGSVPVVRAVAVALALAVLFRILNGRYYNMSATNVEYMQLFGTIANDAVAMARCACVTCNSCTCACSCRVMPEEDIIW